MRLYFKLRVYGKIIYTSHQFNLNNEMGIYSFQYQLEKLKSTYFNELNVEPWEIYLISENEYMEGIKNDI